MGDDGLVPSYTTLRDIHGKEETKVFFSTLRDIPMA